MFMFRSDSSIFSSLYQFMTGPTEGSNQKQPAPEDAEATKFAQVMIYEYFPFIVIFHQFKPSYDFINTLLFVER